MTSRRLLVTLIVIAALLPVPVLAQTSTTGTVSVTVLDPSGASIANAQLEIKDLVTNVVYKGATTSYGTFAFPNLPFGTYQLTISASGFQNQVFESVQVQTARNTDIHAVLKVGSTSETVTVTTTEAPLVEPESSVLATTIDTKQVVELPIQNRSMFGLSFLIPGWASTQPGSTAGTWNNMPGGAIVSADFDGTQAISNRFRSGGFSYGTSVVQPRIENIAEMTVQTAQLDLSGTGSSAMKISMVTRRGSNAFHGRVFEDFQNTWLNANSWSNNARRLPRNITKLNDFGFSAGGPIIKNKLFFFGTFAESISPRSISASASYLNPSAQAGVYQYRDSSGALQSVNVLQIGASGGGSGTVLPAIASQLQKINGVIGEGVLTQTSDPNLSTLSWQYAARQTIYYPAMRFDYNLNDNIRLSASYTQQKTVYPGANAANWPGGIDPMDLTSSNGNNKIAGFGFDYTIRPTLINQFHGGFMEQYSIFDPENLGFDLPSIQEQFFQYGNGLYDRNYPRQPISSMYPMFSWTDSLNWQKGSHTLVFGGGWFREQDHYWNGPGGYPGIYFGIAGGDPVGATFVNALKNLTTTQQTQAQNLYAELTGRISSVYIAGGGRPLDFTTKKYKDFGAYNLNEAMQAGNMFVQDRWHVRQNLTLNYGLRWDIVGDDHDLTGAYASPGSIADIWGPTPPGAIFQPGNLGGVQNPGFQARSHVYKTSWVNPQPAVALAWSPHTAGLLGKIFPDGKTVVRTGWSLRNYQEGAQNYWAFASNQGSFFFQQGSLSADTSGAVGTFQPGSLILGMPLPAYSLSPATWSSTVPQSALSFNNSFFGMNPNIRQPYVEQWNFGVERQIGAGSAIELRYVGNIGMHTWMSYNINEVNIFENGFLKEFQDAQNNLKINQANGKGNTFANNGLAGQVGLPIFETAFHNLSASQGFTNGTFITNLNTGAAGSIVRTLQGATGNVSYFCNMVGTRFSPCAARGYTNPGTYPINFFTANPYSTGLSDNYLDAVGKSNYHSLQIEYRQRQWHGMQFNANYTLGHTLVLGPVNAYQANTGGAGYTTNRNFRLDYRPSPYDVRHIFHLSGTYDLPFGKGKRFLHEGKALNYAVGGWTIGTIMVMQSGPPVQFSGGYNTANNTDSGVIFAPGVTGQTIQNAVGIYRGGNPWVMTINPSLVAGNGAISSSYYVPNIYPGVWGAKTYIYGPHWFNDDLSINKYIPIKESIRGVLQGQFLNVFNHPAFGLGSINAQALNFGQNSGTITGARRIEIRANIEF